MNNEQNNLPAPSSLLICKIYPLTIVTDRNGGMYSKGKYLAFNNYVEDIPKGIDGNDKDQEMFWNTKWLFNKYKIGKGNTINDAVLDLHSKMQHLNEKNLAEAYQPLFDVMNNEHDKILTVGEMNEIISAVSNVNKNLTELYQQHNCSVAEFCSVTDSVGLNEAPLLKECTDTLLEFLEQMLNEEQKAYQSTIENYMVSSGHDYNIEMLYNVIKMINARQPIA